MTAEKPIFLQTWWEENTESKMGEFSRWTGGFDAQSKVFCRKYIASKSYESILDCGCGLCTEYYGYKSDGYPIVYKGIDATPRLVSIGQGNGIDIIHGYLESIPAPDASVDVCYIRHILEHLPCYDEAISEAMRVAAKEVVICWFIKPDDADDAVNYDSENNLYHNKYNRDGVVALVESHPKFKSLEWIEINAQESMLAIQLTDKIGRMVTTGSTAARLHVGTYPEEGLAQLKLLLLNGLRRNHSVLEVGCGALSASVPIMDYLESGRFVGIEPNSWLIDDASGVAENQKVVFEKKPAFLHNVNFDASSLGIDFDFVISHSVLSHAGYSQLDEFLVNTHRCLKQDGVLLFSLNLAEPNSYGRLQRDEMEKNTVWSYPGGGFFNRSTVIEQTGGLFADVEIIPEYTKIISNIHASSTHDWVRCRGKK